MIFIPIMWYKSQINNSTLDIQLHDTYLVIGYNYIVYIPLLYLALCALIYNKRQGLGLTPWMTLSHLVVSIFYCSYYFCLSLNTGSLRRYYSYDFEPPLPQWYETPFGMFLILTGIFLLAQIIFLLNLRRARRM